MVTQARSDVVIREIALDRLKLSGTNKRAETADVSELAESMKENGLLHPIVVRLLPDSMTKSNQENFEIIAGGRRWKAAQKLGWPSIMCSIRNTSDDDARDLTAVENLQREDLPMMDQAQEIENLLKGERTILSVAKKIGRTPQWTAMRARLLHLSLKWKKLIAANPAKWPVAHLEKIARFESDIQDRLFERVQYSVPTAKDLNNMLSGLSFRLAAAPWLLNDADLVKEAGPCSACPKRSGVQPELFAEFQAKKGDERCLDSICYAKKKQAWVNIRFDIAKTEHKNIIRVVSDSDDRNFIDRGVVSENPLSDGALGPYQYTNATPKTKKAVPAFVVDGKNSGEIRWILTHASSDSERGRAAGQLKSMKERREALDKRRRLAFIEEVKTLLQSECGKPDISLKIGMVDIITAVAYFGSERDHSRQNVDPWNLVLVGIADLPVNPAFKIVKMEALTGVYRNWSDHLRSECQYGDGKTGVEFAENVCKFLGILTKGIHEAISDDIPEPKVWATLNADGSPKVEKKSEGKGKKG